MDTQTYRHLLKDASTVIYTVGILLESEYKSIVGAKSPLEAIKRLGNKLHQSLSPPNPLTHQQVKHSEHISYQSINKTGAIKAAREAAKHDVGSFMYVSAAAGFPGIPKGYIRSKREAEAEISLLENIRSCYIRPGFMYSPLRPMTVQIGNIIEASRYTNQNLLRNTMGSCLGAAAMPPLNVHTVAKATVEAILDESIKGPVNIELIQQLASKK